MCLDEGRRKSARILALEEEKKNKAFTYRATARPAAPPAKTKRGRKRKRLEDVLSFQQDTENQEEEDNSIQNDEAAENLSPTQQVSDSRVLEFVLDALERRDTYGIFANPVDPQEVTTYYNIIKEPMDFGTMRTKLKEGTYASLEQFEHDVSLISSNAMHFNSSATIFYKEAQGIQELAQQIFHALKTDPKRFQFQFLLSRRCPGGKPQSETRSLHTKLGKPNGGVKRIGRPPLRGSSLKRKTQKGRPSSKSIPHVDQGHNENYAGLRDGRNSNLFLTERRQTYLRPSKEKESIISTVFSSPKSLVHIDDPGGSGYKESLMRFVKGLGPTAQMVAMRKLEKCLIEEAPNSQPQTTPSNQTQIDLASAPYAPVVPDHLVGVNSGQMHHNPPFDLPLSDHSNASYFHGDASAQGYYAHTSSGGIHIHDGSTAYKGKMNAPSTSGLGMVPTNNINSNHSDPKGKAVLEVVAADIYDLTREKMISMELQDMERRVHLQDQFSKVQAADVNNNMDIYDLTREKMISMELQDMERRAHLQDQYSKVQAADVNNNLDIYDLTREKMISMELQDMERRAHLQDQYSKVQAADVNNNLDIYDLTREKMISMELQDMERRAHLQDQYSKVQAADVNNNMDIYDLTREKMISMELQDMERRVHLQDQCSKVQAPDVNNNMDIYDLTREKMISMELQDMERRAHLQDQYSKVQAADVNNNMDIFDVTREKMISMELQESKMEGRAHLQDQNSKVQLKAHLCVFRDWSSPGTSNGSIKFRTVDMLAKRQSRLQEIMSRSNTYLRPSSNFMPSSSAAKLSSLSQQASTSSHVGAQLSKYIANSALEAQLLQWGIASTAQGPQEISSFPNMNVRFDEDYNPLGNGTYMRKEEQLLSSAQGMPLCNAVSSYERANTQCHQNKPPTQSFLSLLVDSEPDLTLQL